MGHPARGHPVRRRKQLQLVDIALEDLRVVALLPFDGQRRDHDVVVMRAPVGRYRRRRHAHAVRLTTAGHPRQQPPHRRPIDLVHVRIQEVIRQPQIRIGVMRQPVAQIRLIDRIVSRRRRPQRPPQLGAAHLVLLHQRDPPRRRQCPIEPRPPTTVEPDVPRTEQRIRRRTQPPHQRLLIRRPNLVPRILERLGQVRPQPLHPHIRHAAFRHRSRPPLRQVLRTQQDPWMHPGRRHLAPLPRRRRLQVLAVDPNARGLRLLRLSPTRLVHPIARPGLGARTTIRRPRALAGPE